MKPPLKILLLGKGGQVGWELQRSLASPSALAALKGIYHLAAASEISWYGYAQHAFTWAWTQCAKVKLDDAQLKAIARSDYETAAYRPLNSWLNFSKLKLHFSLHLPIGSKA
jgi:dTDP-4-dehydrorhamnose reductase